MNQPIAAKSAPNAHLVPTVLIGIVCVLCLSAAAVGLYSSHSAKFDICNTVSQQLWGLQVTFRNDHRLIPHGVKTAALQTMDSSQAFLAQHCPVESIKKPEAADTGDPKQIMHQLLGSMLD